MGVGIMAEKTKKEAKFRHGMLAFGLLAAVMFGCVVGLGTDPQIPMLIGCVISGFIALYLGFDWEEILDAMKKGIDDSMEACLILICIGVMVAVWILSGTVPTMIYYGLEVVTPQLFLPVCFLATLVIGIVVGAWGAAGTIGLAFIGIAAALDVPLGMAAGAIVGAAYVSEIVSPLVDGPNLAAAIAEVDVFALCKRFLPLVVAVCLACAGIYAVIGFGLDASVMHGAEYDEMMDYIPGFGLEASGDAGASTASILSGLEGSFNIGPVTLIPLVVMVVCIAFQVPAIPSFLAGIAVGAIEAVFYQGVDASLLLSAMVRGAESNTGAQFIDTLLSTGGINEMLETISIILLVMAYAGIMQHCGLMASMVEPIVSRLKNFVSLAGATVFSGALFNVLLPDQYPAITMSTLVYRDEYNRRGVDRAAWGNIVNSSAGITSVLVPWNTCAIYMVTILGVSCVDYMGYAFFCYLYPIVVFVVAALFGKKLGWVSKGEPRRRGMLRHPKACRARRRLHRARAG